MTGGHKLIIVCVIFKKSVNKNKGVNSVFCRWLSITDKTAPK